MGQFYGDRMCGKDNQYLEPNQVLCSCEGRFMLRYQTDGNLVIYEVPNNKVIWAINKFGSPDKACMQDDGNFVVYDKDSKPIWASNTSGNSNSKLIMQDDANLVVYDKDGKPIWASNTAIS